MPSPPAEEDMQILETKVVVLGHTGVGKTSMVNKYVRGQFTGNTTATIGAAFMKKHVIINNWKIILQIWDTAGQERFRSMAPMYYRGAHAAILVFDVSANETLGKAAEWVEELKGHANDDITMVLAANKSDLRAADPSSCISQQQSIAYAKTINAGLFETSAKTGKGVDELFTHVAKQLLKAELNRIKSQEEEDRRRNVDLTGNANAPPKGGGCCS